MAEKEKDAEITLVSQLDTKKPIYRIKGKPPRIETQIDKLYRMVRERGKIRISEAAENLGVSEDTVREWGEILEEHKLIEVHYPIAGKPSLGIRRLKLPRAKRKKEKKPRIPRKKRFTKKVVMIYIEIIALGQLLIYIFFVNRHLSMNFMPTVRFHFNGFYSYLLNILDVLTSGNFSKLLPHLLSQPFYLAFLIILIIIIILIIVLIIKSRKRKPYVKEKKEEEKPKKEEPKKEKKPEKKKETVFADIIERYEKKLKEIER